MTGRLRPPAPAGMRSPIGDPRFALSVSGTTAGRRRYCWFRRGSRPLDAPVAYNVAVRFHRWIVSAVAFEDSRVAVLIPAYNEESQILKVLESVPEYVDDIVVVDDASTDGTSSTRSSVRQKPINASSPSALTRIVVSAEPWRSRTRGHTIMRSTSQ